MKRVPNYRDEFHIITLKTNNFNNMKTKLILFLLSLSLLGAAQNGSLSIDKAMDKIITPGDSYFEVTKDMFTMLSESKGVSPEYVNYIKQLHKLKMIQPGRTASNHGEIIVKTFLENTDLQSYTRLMTRRDNHEVLHFYKKEGKNENEFLLVSSDMIIYITGTLDLKSIGEFQQVMEIAGSAFDM